MAAMSRNRVLLLIIGLSAVFSSASGQNTTCGPNYPCAQGCCSNDGWCGFSPSFCGAGNCTSSCDALVECGDCAAPGHFDCPLNVCCSREGYCGTTDLFCGDGCQSGCDAVSGMILIDGDQARLNPGYAISKLRATQAQNTIPLLHVWSACQSKKDYTDPCPPGFKILTKAHGKIYDLDTGHIAGDGCHGGNKGSSRALCVEKSLQYDGCAWYGKGKGCNASCPKGTLLITQTSHGYDHGTGCKIGSYASFCCRNMLASHVQTCQRRSADVIFSQGMMPAVRLKGRSSPGDAGLEQFVEGSRLECIHDPSAHKGDKGSQCNSSVIELQADIVAANAPTESGAAGLMLWTAALVIIARIAWDAMRRFGAF